MADVKNLNGYTIKDSTARSNIGTLSSLGTTDKTSLVAAINEVNTALAGKQAAGNYKTTQTAVTNPSASGTTITAIDTITQNTNGVITATKKTIRSASGSQTGVVQYGTSTPVKDGTAAVGTGNAARVDHVHPLNVDTTAPAGLTAITGTSSAGSASTYARRDHTHSVSIRSASTSQTGIVQLNDSFISSSTTQAATANTVKTLNAEKLNIPRNVTYAELVELRNNSNLEPGRLYRITDYVTTTAQTDTQSAGHAFDIIVRADSVYVLNENATAALHSGDTYFSSSKLNAWKLKYCLDNDTTRFAWADTTNGKGVIYRMIDEWGNDLPYDFKNIQFKRWQVAGYLVNESQFGYVAGILNSLISTTPALRWGLPVYESAEDAIEDNGNQWWIDATSGYQVQNTAMGQWKVDDNYDLLVLSNDSSKWFYTFSNLTSDSADVTDGSLNVSGAVKKNKFGFGGLEGNAVLLGNNVFIGDNFNNNTVGNSFNYNTVGNNFNNNTVGNNFYNNTVGNYYKWNHFEDGCQNLKFTTNGTSSSYVQKYRVLAGTAPSTAQTVSVTAGNTIPYNVKQTGASSISVAAA